MLPSKHVVIVALRDCNLTTAVRKVGYRRIEGLPNNGRPEGQAEHDEIRHGISLRAEQVIELDLKSDQIAHIQAHIDAGDIIADGMSASPAPAPAVQAKGK